ncbi:MAG: hypothetical protein ACI9ZH_002017 [Paracoccaceae bacterium]|jgi:hypothetical protein
MMTLGKVRAAIFAAILATPSAGSAENGRDAFARSDYAAAAALWRAEAAAGSADAKFGLGLIADLGLGAARDAAAALRWYLEAADNGVAEAQFNVGVMLDSGAGGARDVGAAAAWYARAAVNGHARAQYNLALLFELGEGLPLNPDLARHWFERAAAALPAAASRLASLPPVAEDARIMAPPRVLAGAVTRAAGGAWAEMAWAAPPGPEGATFALAVIALGAAGAGQGAWLETRTLDASAAIAALPDANGAYAWRVSRVAMGPARYAATPWQRLGEVSGAGELPAGRLTIESAEDDLAATRLAQELATGMRGAGMWVTVATWDLAQHAAVSEVAFGYAEDADLAGAIAVALPFPAQTRLSEAPDAVAPGGITVRLIDGPDAAAETVAAVDVVETVEEAAPDLAAAGVVEEAIPDANPDAASDATPDVAPAAADVAADVTQDVTQDLALIIAPDAAPDGVSGVAPYATLDAVAMTVPHRRR